MFCKSHRHPYAIRSDGERNPIVTRTQSDRTANAIRLDGERNLIGRRTQSDWAADANGDVSTETMNVLELIIGKGHLKNYE